jgi:hypothetical protein
MQGSHERSGVSFWFNHDDEAGLRGRETFLLFFRGLPHAFSVTSMISNIVFETHSSLGSPNLHICNELTKTLRNLQIHLRYVLNLRWSSG